MPTEEQIKEMAYYLWEQAGKPVGNDQEYYYRAKQTLEEREAAEKRAADVAPTPVKSETPSKASAPRRTTRRRK